VVTLPALDGVKHNFVDAGGGVTIHVADAGPAEGDAGARLPGKLAERHELIGPLAADGYRVLCPDLRGAGAGARRRACAT
jgi:pimeloyl-ACP methyl ester carboxylesterase